MSYQEIAKKISTMSKDKGITATSICSLVGKQRGWLKDLCSGRGKISDEQLFQISEFLGTTPEYLKGETDVKEKPAPSGELSDEEAKLLEFFNQLPPQVQSIFANMQKLSPAQLDALEAVVRSYLPQE